MKPVFSQNSELNEKEIGLEIRKILKDLSYNEKLELLRIARSLKEGESAEFIIRDPYGSDYDDLTRNRENTTKKSESLLVLLPASTIIWEESSFGFGEIKAGATIQHNFNFENTSQDTARIISIYSSCGCTTIDSGQEIIPPNSHGNIKVKFDSYRRSGDQHKLIMVKMNTVPEIHVLSLKGTVID